MSPTSAGPPAQSWPRLVDLSRDRSAYYVSEDCESPIGTLLEGSYLEGHWSEFFLDKDKFVVVRVNGFEITPTFLVSRNYLKTEEDL